MGVGAQVGTSPVLSACLRYVAVVSRLLMVAASGSVVAETRDDAEGSAAMAGVGVVSAACRGVACSTSKRAAIERALLEGALRPRFPGNKVSAFYAHFHEIAEGVFGDVLAELAVRDTMVGLLQPRPVEGPTRGQTFLHSCGELAAAVTETAGNPPGASGWLERYEAELREQFELAPLIAFGVDDHHEGAHDA
jgi:hypothetical protein